MIKINHIMGPNACGKSALMTEVMKYYDIAREHPQAAKDNIRVGKNGIYTNKEEDLFFIGNMGVIEVNSITKEDFWFLFDYAYKLKPKAMYFHGQVLSSFKTALELNENYDNLDYQAHVIIVDVDVLSQRKHFRNPTQSFEHFNKVSLSQYKLFTRIHAKLQEIDINSHLLVNNDLDDMYENLKILTDDTISKDVITNNENLRDDKFNIKAKSLW